MAGKFCSGSSRTIKSQMKTNKGMPQNFRVGRGMFWVSRYLMYQHQKFARPREHEWSLIDAAENYANSAVGNCQKDNLD